MNHQDHIGELLKIAGHRHMPAPEHMARARAAAHTEWMHVVRHRRWRFSALALGTVALVALTIAAVTWFKTEQTAQAPVPAADVASVQRIIGSLVITRAGSPSPVTAEPGMRVRAGDRIDTPAGSRAAFVLSGGALARLDEDSRITLHGADTIALARGAVFVDAAGDGPARLHVRTPLGVVRHIGTQFEVRLQDGGLRVRVREGTIVFERANSRWLSSAGEALVIGHDGDPGRESISTSGAEWEWLDQLAPPFALEGSTFGSFLRWIGRHHGLRWEYEDPAMAARVERIVLHGSIEGLTAEEALQAVLPTCGLAFRRRGDLIVISKRQ